jgi:hypothetical protein
MAATEREKGATVAGRDGEGSVDKAAWDIRRARCTGAAEEERRAAAIAGVGPRRRLQRSLYCNVCWFCGPQYRDWINWAELGWPYGTWPV